MMERRGKFQVEVEVEVKVDEFTSL